MSDNLTPMWIVHLWNLLVESVATAPRLISGNWPAVFFTIALAIIGGFLEWIKEGRPPMKEFFKRWASVIKTGTAAAVIGWVLLIGVNMSVTIYRDHMDLMKRNAAQTKENLSLKQQLANPVPVIEPEESKNSLRRRTLALVSDLYIFWAERPMPPQPTPNAATDEDKARVATSQKYWRETQAAYSIANFNQRILGIVREYKAKGIDTGSLESQAEQPDRLMGAVPFGGFDLQHCDFYANELCQIRELAYHVDSHDQPIFLTIEQPQPKRRK